VLKHIQYKIFTPTLNKQFEATQNNELELETDDNGDNDDTFCGQF
jgi:hypothetical protein